LIHRVRALLFAVADLVIDQEAADADRLIDDDSGARLLRSL
jgi:hypothetical protein